MAMKIMILVPAFGRSSPVQGALLLAKYLHHSGQNVLFVSLDNRFPQHSLSKDIAETGISFDCINARGWFGLINVLPRLQRYIDVKAVDVVLAYEMRPTLITSFLRNVIKMASVRGMLREVYPLYYPYGRFLLSIFTSVQMMALRKMDHVFSMTQAMTEWLVCEGVNPKKISCINNFVDVANISATNRKNKKKHQDITKIGVFCNFVPAKRLDIALKAFGKIVLEYKNNTTHLHLVGDGPLRREIERLAYDLGIVPFCFFHGFLEDPLPLMSQMDLILLTSASEGVPRCLMEALSLGKTVIASNIPGINDLIIHGQTGFLFEAGDVDGLANLIHSVIIDKSYFPPNELVDFMLNNFDVNSCGQIMFQQILKVFENKRQAQQSPQVTLSTNE